MCVFECMKPRKKVLQRMGKGLCRRIPARLLGVSVQTHAGTRFMSQAVPFGRTEVEKRGPSGERSRTITCYDETLARARIDWVTGERLTRLDDGSGTIRRSDYFLVFRCCSTAMLLRASLVRGVYDAARVDVADMQKGSSARKTTARALACTVTRCNFRLKFHANAKEKRSAFPRVETPFSLPDFPLQPLSQCCSNALANSQSHFGV